MISFAVIVWLWLVGFGLSWILLQDKVPGVARIAICAFFPIVWTCALIIYELDKRTSRSMGQGDGRGRRWLRSRGWTLTNDQKWRHPSGLDFASSMDALEVAYADFLKEMGWKKVRVRTVMPYPSDRSEQDWQHLIHPKSGKVYMWLEACEMARFHDNSDENWASCGKSIKLNGVLEKANMKAEEGDRIVLRCYHSAVNGNWYMLDRVDKGVDPKEE